jgi:hypothetical protein
VTLNCNTPGAIRRVDGTDLDWRGWSANVDHPQTPRVIRNVGESARHGESVRGAGCFEHGNFDRRRGHADVDHLKGRIFGRDVRVVAGHGDVVGFAQRGGEADLDRRRRRRDVDHA